VPVEFPDHSFLFFVGEAVEASFDLFFLMLDIFDVGDLWLL